MIGRVNTKMEAPAPQVQSTFEHLILPHLDAAYNLARWILRHDGDAEDAVQNAFLRAYQAFSRFRGSNGRAWLLCIVRNVCYSHLRKNRQGPDVEPFVEESHSSTETHAETNALLWEQAKGDLLRRALDQLSAEYREVIILHEIEGLSYREIAEVSEIPIGTVMSRLARARQKLQTEVRMLAGKDCIQ